MSRRRKRHGSGHEAGMERWLLSYSDFITLLMVFFIMMYAMSKVDVARYNAIAQSLNVILSGTSISPEPQDTQSVTPTPEQPGAQLSQDLVNQLQLDAVQQKIQEFIAAEGVSEPAQSSEQSTTKLGDYIVIASQERGLVISIKDTLLFPSGSDQLTPVAREIISKVGIALVMVPNYIRVEGHTDNLAINTGKFPSNWELSALRATNVMHVLVNDSGIAPDRLSVVGYGEYRPLVPNQDLSSQARNRRVDIVVMKRQYDELEPPKATATVP